MFDGFRLDRVDVGDVQLRVHYGGHGPAVLLLHGHPRTHTTWHQVAPLLARDYTVVCPDLRGGPFNSGHRMAEENPDELVRTLRAFLDNS